MKEIVAIEELKNNIREIAVKSAIKIEGKDDCERATMFHAVYYTLQRGLPFTLHI